MGPREVLFYCPHSGMYHLSFLITQIIWVVMNGRFFVMKMKKYIIAGGNPTLLVWGCPPAQKQKVLKQYLGEVEQIGFVDESNGTSRLTMMGYEMCINATLALSYDLGGNDELFSSGFNRKIVYENRSNSTKITFPLKYESFGDIILLPGIGFLFTKNNTRVSKDFISLLGKMFRRPAFGLCILNRNKITPTIYVQKTKTLIKETACGSASVAANILIGVDEVKQPTGETITVSNNGVSFSVAAKVKEVKFYDQK